MINTETDSKAEQLLQSMGVDYHASGMDQSVLQTCPLCHNQNGKFYINTSGGEKDGLWGCKVCSEEGNLYQLKEKLGLRTHNVTSTKDIAQSRTVAPPLPDYRAAHKRLMENEDYGDALEYLLLERGLSMSTIEKFKIGVEDRAGKPWLIYPYLGPDETTCIFTKHRNLNPSGKDDRFVSSLGREVPLFNENVIKPGMTQLVLVEGEVDTLSLYSLGFQEVVGVPGANIKKATWIDKLDKVENVYLLYDRDEVGQKAARDMASRIGIDKVKNIVLPIFSKADGTPGKDINELILTGLTLEAFETLKKGAKAFDVEGIYNLSSVLEELNLDLTEHGSEPTLKTPWPSLTKTLGGCEWGDVIGILADAKIGKLQPLSAKVLTPSGWTTMGKLKVGDKLASVDGAASEVTNIYPHGVKDMYRVLFSDGRSTLAGKDHLWSVGSVTNFSRDGYRVVDTEELIRLSSLSLDNNSSRFFVPLFSGDWGIEAELPIQPWLLGALIGDGGLTESVRFTKKDPKVISRLRFEVERAGCTLNQHSEMSYSITGCQVIRQGIVSLGLNCKSIYKFIPEIYKSASRKQRLELLQGLMDTDGSVEGKYKVPVFNTSSPQLAVDVQDLVRSLGGSASLCSRIPTYSLKGQSLQGQRAYRINIKLKDPVCVDSHKAASECVRVRDYRLSVVSVTPEKAEDSQCITVSHPSELYITDDFIVTHNSTTCLNWLQFYVEQGYNCLNYCQEMLPKRVVRKWVSMVTHTDDTPGVSKITTDVVNNAFDIASQFAGEMLFGYTKGANPKQVFETIRQAVRRYGVKVVCFDNLHLMARSLEHRTQELSKLSKEFKDLAMELNILILLILQPTKIQQGSLVEANNASGSGDISKDVDGMVVLNRRKCVTLKENDLMHVIETNETFEPYLYANVGLCRYGTGGYCTLYFEGATSTVRELGNTEYSEFSTSKTQGIIQTELVAA